MWPSVSFSLSSSPSSTKVVKPPGVGAASEATLVDSSPGGGPEKTPVPQESPAPTGFPGFFASLVSPGSHISAKSSDSADFEESPILKSFSPCLLSYVYMSLTCFFAVTQIERVLTMDRSIMGPWQRSEK